jgi:hypothetical protein
MRTYSSPHFQTWPCCSFMVGSSSLLFFNPREMTGCRLLLLAGGRFGGEVSAFFLADAGGFGLFLAGFLLVGFRGFVAHNFYFWLCD